MYLYIWFDLPYPERHNEESIHWLMPQGETFASSCYQIWWRLYINLGLIWLSMSNQVDSEPKPHQSLNDLFLCTEPAPLWFGLELIRHFRYFWCYFDVFLANTILLRTQWESNTFLFSGAVHSSRKCSCLAPPNSKYGSDWNICSSL